MDSQIIAVHIEIPTTAKLSEYLNPDKIVEIGARIPELAEKDRSITQEKRGVPTLLSEKRTKRISIFFFF